MPPNNKSWNEYRKFVVETLDRHSSHFNEIFGRLGKIEVEIARLKVKAGVWGLIGGLIPVLIAMTLLILRTLFSGRG